MKKLHLKLFSIFTLILAFATSASAQFEGTIEFVKKSKTDTTDYIYTVKGNKVKIEEIGSRSKKIVGTFLLDMEAKTYIMLNNERKIYMYQKTPAAPVIVGTPEVKKGTNVKTLQGYKCQEYIITNKDENTQITYYLANDKFTFFEKLLRHLNRKEKSAVYYLLLPEISNAFPMLSTHTDMDGKHKETFEVTKITKKSVSDSDLEIPKGYNKFEK